MTDPVLTFDEADELRRALAALGYTQAFDEAHSETWFAPEARLESSVLFFSLRETGVVVSYSNAKVYKTVTFAEATVVIQGEAS